MRMKSFDGPSARTSPDPCFHSAGALREDIIVAGGSVIVDDRGRKIGAERPQVEDAAADALAAAAAGAGPGRGGICLAAKSPRPLLLFHVSKRIVFRYDSSEELQGQLSMSNKRIGRFICADPKICRGKPTFRGTRILVGDVLELVAAGMTWDAIIEECHGSISRSAIAEAIRLASRSISEHAHE